MGEPAATVIVFRHARETGAAEILLVERSSRLAFAGGATVFPGGKVDPADRALAVHEMAGKAREGAGLDPEDVAGRIAAVRETLEETGLLVGLVAASREAAPFTAVSARAARVMLVEEGGALAPVLARFGWTLDLEGLVPWARWWPRDKPGRIFDTRFYLADLGTGAVDLAVDGTENRRLFWASARDALALADKGAIHIIYPTRRNLERLADFPDFAACRAHAQTIPVVPISPRMVLREGCEWLMIPPGHGYPVLGEPLRGAIRD